MRFVRHQGQANHVQSRGESRLKCVRGARRMGQAVYPEREVLNAFIAFGIDIGDGIRRFREVRGKVFGEGILLSAGSGKIGFPAGLFLRHYVGQVDAVGIGVIREGVIVAAVGKEIARDDAEGSLPIADDHPVLRDDIRRIPVGINDDKRFDPPAGGPRQVKTEG